MQHTNVWKGRRGHDRMVVGFTITYAISAYHHYYCEFESRSWRGILDTTLCDKACQWFSADTPVSSTNKTDRRDITEILLKVLLNTITQMCGAVVGLISQWATDIWHCGEFNITHRNILFDNIWWKTIGQYFIESNKDVSSYE
jgi:hypothetical protein